MSRQTLLDLFDSLADYSARDAIVYRTEVRRFVWPYRRVTLAANQLAAYLQRAGYAPGERILLWVDNSPYWVAIFFACLLAGLVAVPLDPRSRPEYVRAVQAQTAAGLVFRSRFSRDPGFPVPSCFVEDLDAILAEPVRLPNRPPIGPDTVAEIIYTSGTTGTPKGVMLSHRNLLFDLLALDQVVPNEPLFRLLPLLPLSHAFGQQAGLLLPFMRGGEAVYLELLAPGAIQQALANEAVLALVTVPRLFAMILDQIQHAFSGAPGGAWLFAAMTTGQPELPRPVRRLVQWLIRRRLGGRLKYLVSGGAALEPALERAWDRLGFIVLQGYGLTEAAPVVTFNRPDQRRVGTVGKPLPGEEVCIAPDGEVLVRGPNVMLGYFAGPTETAEALKDGWLRTGDLGYLDPDGFLHITGRKKELIVTAAGVNVCPSDLEEVLDEQSGVRASCVVWWRDRIYAVLLPTNPASFDPRAVVTAANQELAPSQQIQGSVVWPYADFPRTALLKINRREVLAELPAITAGAAPPIPPGIHEPFSAVRQVLAQVAGVPITRVRGDETLGADLGLGSVDRLEVATLLEQDLHAEIDADALTGQTTVAELERLVTSGRCAPHPGRVGRWARWPVVSWLRQLVWRVVLFPAMHLICRPLRIEGQEHLAGFQGPAIFVANHTSHLDAPVVLMALPPELRNRLAFATWAEFFAARPAHPLSWLAHRIALFLALAIFNIFLVPHRRGFRSSLQEAGRLVDHHWNLFVFPEGTRTPTGRMQQFEEGIGLFVTALKVPIVPLWIDGLYSVLPRGCARWPSPGPVLVRIGQPFWVRSGSYLERTARIEAAVCALAHPEASP